MTDIETMQAQLDAASLVIANLTCQLDEANGLIGRLMDEAGRASSDLVGAKNDLAESLRKQAEFALALDAPQAHPKHPAARMSMDRDRLRVELMRATRERDEAQASLQAVEAALLGQPYTTEGLTPYTVSTLLPLAEQVRRERDEVQADTLDMRETSR